MQAAVNRLVGGSNPSVGANNFGGQRPDRELWTGSSDPTRLSLLCRLMVGQLPLEQYVLVRVQPEHPFYPWGPSGGAAVQSA